MVTTPRDSRQLGYPMRIAGWWFLLLLQSMPALAIGDEQARHLLARTGFGGTRTEIAQLHDVSYEQAVDRIVARAAAQPAFMIAPPAWADEPVQRNRDFGKDSTKQQRRDFKNHRYFEALDVQGWWVAQMLATPTPLTERMTLFWHGHFATSLQKVHTPPLVYRQNLMLREHALGNFRELLHAVARDPAMLLYLDSRNNRRGHPNENFARELLELFTLGQGRYSETDVKEAARAFTGWTIDAKSLSFRIDENQHDYGEKEFLGQHGELDGDAVLDIILKQPAFGEFIVEKLWREFVSDPPDPAQVQRLAAFFRKDYEIAPVVTALLKTKEFRDAGNHGVLIKSPVDLVVGSYRQMEIKPADPTLLAVVCARLGQMLFGPPNVKGWPGGESWITSQTLVLRRQFLDSLLRGYQSAPADASYTRGARARLARTALMNASDHDPTPSLQAFVDHTTPAQRQSLLLAIAPVQAPMAPTQDLDHLRALLLDPAYQLK